MSNPLHILIVDDDELDRMAIIRALNIASSAIKITQADNAAIAISLAKQTHFDVILLDFRLPDRDGIEVLMELRHSINKKVIVVMLSRQDDEKLAELAIRQGAQDFLLKDEVTPKRLIRAVHQAQHRHKLEEELRISHEKLRQLAELDKLTGLANRYEFECALQLAVARAQRDCVPIAVLLLDIDRFKQVNDTFGHDVGDKLLVEASHRLNGVVRESDLLARLGGDEFVVLMYDLYEVKQAIILADRIVKAFAQPMSFNDTDWTMTTSVGIAVMGDSADNAIDLLKCADIAMYRAKQEGRNQAHFYSNELHEYVRLRNLLELDIRNALICDQFVLFYQAQIDSQSGKLVGMEALIRWQHPERGLLAPGQFLDLAEELGLMVDIGVWILETACKQLKYWHSLLVNEKKLPTIAVNLSALQLHNNKLLETIDHVLKKTGLDAQYLELEITESDIIKNPEKVAIVLRAIAARGVRLALDDFGTGFSSFEHLKLFPIHNLKIDRSFVSGIGDDIEPERLLAAMISFARTLELTVTAEGVETVEQAEFCKNKGADVLQGYYFARPLSASDFELNFLTCCQGNDH
jgi:diguanylate cyclase